MTRALSVLLIVAQIILVATIIIFLCGVVIMGTDNGVRAQLLAEAVNPPAPMQVVIACLGGAVIAASWFWVLRLLRRVVISVIHGDPFLPENVSRLRMIWIVIAASEVFRMVLHSLSNIAIENGTMTPDETGLTISIPTWFFIFVIAAISEAFRHGAALRDENELTI